MSSLDKSLERLEQAAHHRGRSEFCMEASRILYDRIMLINELITSRTLELTTDVNFKGYISNDVRLLELRAMRDALDDMHEQIIEL
ncbi:hypothetical protein N9F11_01595 [Akkermansiaceae bacterium]|nr:hypothetical protein [Akkermansiaceae bacterium]